MTLDKVRELEQALHAHTVQKQAYESQLAELESAREELTHTDEAYRIVGNIMVKTQQDTLKENLEQQQASVKARVDALGKQQANLQNQMAELQKELLGEKDDKV